VAALELCYAQTLEPIGDLLEKLIESSWLLPPENRIRQQAIVARLKEVLS